jgi:hypothetical protein
MTVFGLDYAWSKPSIAALHQAGAKFACRYLSHDATGKSLTRSEANALTAAGIWIVVVWETTANRALSGQAGGVADARAANAQAQACGMPEDRPVYFAVDWDASGAQQAQINAYLNGASSVLGLDRVGMYGGVGPIRRAFDAEMIRWGWQTYAWSGGQWDARAQLQQYKNGVNVGGADCDYDRAVVDDYGQWKVGESPMALSDADVKKIWTTDGIIGAPDGNPKNPEWTPASHLTDLGKQVRSLALALAGVAGKVDGVDEAAIIKGVLAGLSPAAIASAVVAAMPADGAKKVVDELTARLAS